MRGRSGKTSASIPPSFDTQIVAPEYFKAICPGRGEKSRWIDTQIASRRGIRTDATRFDDRHCDGDRTHERPAGGNRRTDFQRRLHANTQLSYRFRVAPTGGMMPPSAAWFVEAAEKITDIYLRYADTFDVDLTEDTRFGYTRRGRSF